MSVVLYIFGVLSALAVLVVVFEGLRSQRLRERHALWWIVGGAAALVISIFPQILVGAAGVLGVGVATNLVFFISIALLFVVCIQMSTELTQLEKRSRRLAESAALLDERVRRLEQERESEGTPRQFFL
ncbi:MAG: DUF2304 domain-containing protein [Rhodoglobus sp.]